GGTISVSRGSRRSIMGRDFLSVPFRDHSSFPYRSSAGRVRPVDPVTERAIADYDTLLRDDRALRQELEANFLEKMRTSGITFGGRVFCAFPRPNLVSSGVYEQIRGVCRGIFRAIEKVERALGDGLWDLVDLQPEERELVAIDA